MAAIIKANTIREDAAASLCVSKFRPMQEQDLPAVLALEKTAYRFPWSPGIFADCLKVGYSCWVVDVRGEVGGYGILSVAAEEAHILNLCLRKDLRKTGLSRRLLAKLLDTARWHRAKYVFLEVRPSNTAAIRLYQKAGFDEAGTRPGYYPDGGRREDALIFALTLLGPGKGQSE